MLVVTYSEARRTFASVLDRAKAEGSVFIKRADGSLFKLVPERSDASPFEGIELSIRLPSGELASALEDARRSQEEWYR
jgi:antitoxin (DNA-binding transcriptional repressor) of toxin-antitoxin stability system